MNEIEILSDVCNLEKQTISKLYQFRDLLLSQNKKINLISRKDEDRCMQNHILHSLAISQFLKFGSNEKIMDVGTGGGLPGIPLAILFPKTKFTLVDSIAKKIRAVSEIAQELELKNVNIVNSRIENIKEGYGSYDFILGRGVIKLTQFYSWTKRFLSKSNPRAGILYLRGDDFQEFANEKVSYEYEEVGKLLSAEEYKGKYLVYIKSNK